MLKFILEGETPSKKNSRVFLKNGRNIPSKNYREWHTKAVSDLYLQTFKQEKNFEPIDELVQITLRFYHGDLRRRDSDNGTSSILDTLCDCGILKDDNWQIVRSLKVYNFYEKNKARCEIEIKKLWEIMEDVKSDEKEN